MKKVLIIGSSMAMPRGEVPYEETWIKMLKENFKDYDFIDKSRRASTTERLVKEGGGYKGVSAGADLLEHYMPDIVITQIGITDCSPRYVNNNSKFVKLLNISPKWFKAWFYNSLKKFSERKIKYADVSEQKFEENWVKFLSRANAINCKLFVIDISPATNILLSKSPKASEAINRYNAILSRLEKDFNNMVLLRPYDTRLINECAIDEFHVNKKGQQIVFDILKELL